MSNALSFCALKQGGSVDKLAALKAKMAGGNYSVAQPGEALAQKEPHPTVIKKVINSHEKANNLKDRTHVDRRDTSLLEDVTADAQEEEIKLLEASPSIPFIAIRKALNDGAGLVFFRGGFYRKGLTFYQAISTHTLKQRVMEFLKEKLPGAYTSGIITSIMATLEFQVSLSAEEVAERLNPPGFFNCVNGVLEFRADGVVLHEHGSAKVCDFIFLDEPRIVYDADTDRTQARRLLECLGDADAVSRRNMVGMIAAGIHPALIRSKVDRIPAMLSVAKQGQNGASVLMEIFTLMFGKSQVCRLNLQEFKNADDNGCRNELYQMQGCRWNLPDENAGGNHRIDAIASLKATLTNGSVDSRNLREKQFSFKPNVVAHFPMNDIPKINYSDDSVTSRYIAIKWPYVFKSKIDKSNPTHRQADLKFNLNATGSEDWIIKNVLPGLLLELVDAFYYTLKKGFDKSETFELLKRAGSTGDHISEFLEEIEAIPSQHLKNKWDNCIALDALFERYMNYCVANHLVVRKEGYEGKFVGYQVLGNYRNAGYKEPKCDPQQLKEHLEKYHKLVFQKPTSGVAKTRPGMTSRNHCMIKVNNNFVINF